MKCIVKDCLNHKHEGQFVGDLCAPCHEFITTGNGKYSQVFRNTVVAEREACIRDCDSVDLAGADDCIAAIKARWQ